MGEVPLDGAGGAGEQGAEGEDGVRVVVITFEGTPQEHDRRGRVTPGGEAGGVLVKLVRREPTLLSEPTGGRGHQ